MATFQIASKWHRKLPKFYLKCCLSPWCCTSVLVTGCTLVCVQKKTWETENERSVFPSLNLLVRGLGTQEREGQTEPAVGHRCWLKYAPVIAQFQITPSLKDHWAPRIFSLPFVYSLQILVPLDKMQTKQFSHTGHSSLLGAHTLSPSAFLSPAFRFGDCTRRARFVTSTIARALVEEKTTIKNVDRSFLSFPERVTVILMAGCGPGRNGAVTSEQGLFQQWVLGPAPRDSNSFGAEP